MKQAAHIPLVTTIREHCRVCYTCVRECPAKAIRIADGQAAVLPERCIGCGNCVRVCSQGAKQVYSSLEDVRTLLAGPAPVAALIAPSFPAEFMECTANELVGMFRAIGFSKVCETAFGADLVARAYRELLHNNDERRYIATTCPAIVAYVERYYPDLVENLAPVVSPMVAAARAVREKYGPSLRIVFVGPCVAKKGEIFSDSIRGEVDASLTFSEARALLAERGILAGSGSESEFDPPRAGNGALFPISRGLLQAAGLEEDLTSAEVVAAEGGKEFIEAIKQFQSGDMDARLLEVLACNGCIMGPGMSVDTPLFQRRGRVSRFVRARAESLSQEMWADEMARCATLDLSRGFAADDRRMPAPSEDELQRILARMGKTKPADELNCGACGYATCRQHAAAIFSGLAESEMCLPYSIEQLRTTVRELAVSNEELARTQDALQHSEKLASMGQLAAGIAHELNNPLGVVLMYAHLLLDEHQGNEALSTDLTLITEQADRCKKIVAGLLRFARQNKVQLQRTSMGKLLDRCVLITPPPPGVLVEKRFEVPDVTAEVDRDQMTQVMVNLLENAYGAMPAGGTVTVSTAGDGERVRLQLRDTGVGIPPENLAKIFEPFFTTKEIGKGTGLGLAVTYGIIKMHRGDIRVESNAEPGNGATGTIFTVTLPRIGEKAGMRPESGQQGLEAKS